jgi:hypothetical protein
MADVCGRSGGGIECYLSDGAGFPTRVIGPEWSDAGGWGSSPAYYSTIKFADVNGDGFADVCGRSGDGTACYLSNGIGFPTSGVGPSWSDEGGWGSSPAYYSTIQFADVNGDGKTDICGRNGSAIECYLSTAP